MTGYFGTEAQQELQRRNHKLAEWMANTPGIYNSGRCIGCEDVSRVPFSTLRDIYERDGVLAFRMIEHGTLNPVLARFEDFGARVDRWDVFVGGAQEALLAVNPILEEDGETGVTRHTRTSDEKTTREVQEFSANNGIAPFPGYLLNRDPPEAITLVQRSDNGEILAVGHAYFPHNSQSRFARYAWVGMISVSPRARGFGLGRHINAALIKVAVKELGATHITQMAASDNPVSRNMIEACGLHLRPELACAVVSPTGTARITR